MMLGSKPIGNWAWRSRPVILRRLRQEDGRELKASLGNIARLSQNGGTEPGMAPPPAPALHPTVGRPVRTAR